MAHRGQDLPGPGQHRTPQGPARKIALDHRGLPGQPGKPLPGLPGLLPRGGHGVPGRRRQAQLLPAHGLDDAGQSLPVQKLIQVLPGGHALRQGHAQPCGQGRQPGLAVEKVQLLRRGDAQPAQGIEVPPVLRDYGQGGRAHRQQGRQAVPSQADLPAQVPERLRALQPHVAAGVPGEGPQGRGGSASPAAALLTGDDLHPRLGQIPDEGQGHAVVDVGNDGNHAFLLRRAVGWPSPILSFSWG